MAVLNIKALEDLLKRLFYDCIREVNRISPFGFIHRNRKVITVLPLKNNRFIGVHNNGMIPYLARQRLMLDSNEEENDENDVFMIHRIISETVRNLVNLLSSWFFWISRLVLVYTCIKVECLIACDT